MRKVLMVAAAAAIALVGLSANTCGGGEEKQAAPEAPAAAPEAPAAAPEAPAPETPPAAPAEPPAQN
jgi:putative iron-regulated protein